MVQGGELGRVYIVQGHYLQDWLLLPTDWNWRLETRLGGDMRTVSDIGSHWLDLTTFITGLKIEAVLADFQTFLPVRKKPTSPVETFAGKMQTAMEYVEAPVNTEDYASVLIRYEGGARGVMTVSQVSAGRKNRVAYEIDGADAAIAWDGEHPNDLWVGHRDRPNELLLKDPALMSSEAQRFASYPGGHTRGLCRHLQRPVQRGIRLPGQGRHECTSRLPHVRGWPHLPAGGGSDLAQRARWTLGGGWVTADDATTR